MSILRIFLTAQMLLLVGGLSAIAFGRAKCIAHALGASTSIIGGLCGLIASFLALTSIHQEDAVFYWGSAGIPLTLHLDALAGFFLLPVFLVVISGALYSWRYIDPAANPCEASRHWSAYNLLAMSMALVITAADGFTFLIAWELMTLASFLLVVHNLMDEQARKAGWLYLIATHLGTVFVFYFFFEAYRRSGSLDFASLVVLKGLPVPQAAFFFVLALIGFGSKAGLFPMHSWLPEAHSAAPSHVSALMSGVMIKTAIYAFLRLVSFLPELPGWAGLLLMTLGMGGALFGIALAAGQSDLKRSLAYSTVENVGIIFLSIGLWLYCRRAGFELAAGLALTGGLLHVWNHAFFKSLLFMGAGAVVKSCGTREMSVMGGLMRRMPITGALMVVGAAAIAALPPLNGLISELFIYISLFTAGKGASAGQGFVFMIFTALLAMVGALVLLVMSRLLGIIFSGEPRSRQAATKHEAAPAMLFAMMIPALVCLAIGIFPQLVLPLITGPIRLLSPGAPDFTALMPLPFDIAWSLGAAVLALLPVAIIAVQWRRHRPDSALSTWGCGFVKPLPSMSYTAGGFAQFAQDEMFCGCLRPILPTPAKASLFPSDRSFRPRIVDPVLNRILTPFFIWAADLANSCRRLQAGSMNIYLTYIFLATLLLLGWNYYLV